MDTHVEAFVGRLDLVFDVDAPDDVAADHAGLARSRASPRIAVPQRDEASSGEGIGHSPAKVIVLHEAAECTRAARALLDSRAMTDWGFDAAAWDEILKTTGRGIEVLGKIADALARWRKATRPEERRTVEKEVEELQADLQKLADMLTEYFKHRRELMESVLRLLGPIEAPEGQRNVDKVTQLIRMLDNLATIVPDHERRIVALERARVGGVE